MTAQAPATAAGRRLLGVASGTAFLTDEEYDRFMVAHILAIERESRAAERAAIRAGVQLRLLAGATDARYSPTEVAELVSAVVDARTRFLDARERSHD